MPEVAAETPETFFTHREACNPYYDAVPEVVEKYLGELSKITGREYHLFSYYGAEDADRMIILMGSATDAAREAIVPMWNKDRSNLFACQSKNCIQCRSAMPLATNGTQEPVCLHLSSRCHPSVRPRRERDQGLRSSRRYA